MGRDTVPMFPRNLNVVKSFSLGIPMDPRMVECADAGLSYQKEYTDSAVTKEFVEIAEIMARKIDDA